MMGRNGIKSRFLIASDLHGSNACFRKLIGLASEVEAHAIILAGDLTGKEFFAISPNGRGRFTYRTAEGALQTLSSDELAIARRSWGERGIYSEVLEDPGEENPDMVEFAKVRRLKQWLNYAEERLSWGGHLFLIPGNDDSPEVVSALEDAPDCVRLVDERVVFFSGFEFAGLGYSNPTPWKTYRELAENELGDRLRRLGKQITAWRRTIMLIHVPPVGSGLDIAPELEEEKDGGLVVVAGEHKEVGSTSVRRFILDYNPMLVACGHCHDSPGFRHMGGSLCINPGSSYQSGTLSAALVMAGDEGVLGFQSLIR